ncbi:hypothetical protein N7G274_001511 [Stereocaulon virgatum]|uniref:Rhodopsin domain-containing protein n=1 Tax=Stereocaulon virgatum TaxID=373712 RepID=A0ABR4AJW2_9LECA
MATIAPPSSPGFDLYANQQERIRISSIVLIILPTIFVILRLVSRGISKAGYWWDDFWIIIALFLCYALPILNIQALSNGFGRHISVLPPDSAGAFRKDIWTYGIFNILATLCIKISILAFYRRIFPIAQLRFVLIIVTAVVLCLLLASLLVSIFLCVPVHAFWESQYRPTATCLDLNLVFLVPGSIDGALNFIIVSMPIPLLWRLRTTKGQKLILTSIFCVAGFVCVCSIIRLVVISRLEYNDITWKYVNASIWNTTNATMGVVGACIPSLRPLFKRLVSDTYHGPEFKGDHDYGSNASSRFIWSPSKGANVDSRPRKFSRLHDTGTDPNANWGFDVHVHGGRSRHAGYEDEMDMEAMETPERRIMVKTEVTLISSARMDYMDQLF